MQTKLANIFSEATASLASMVVTALGSFKLLSTIFQRVHTHFSKTPLSLKKYSDFYLHEGDTHFLDLGLGVLLERTWDLDTVDLDLKD